MTYIGRHMKHQPRERRIARRGVHHQIGTTSPPKPTHALPLRPLHTSRFLYSGPPYAAFGFLTPLFLGRGSRHLPKVARIFPAAASAGLFRPALYPMSGVCCWKVSVG